MVGLCQLDLRAITCHGSAIGIERRCTGCHCPISYASQPSPEFKIEQSQNKRGVQLAYARLGAGCMPLGRGVTGLIGIGITG